MPLKAPVSWFLGMRNRLSVPQLLKNCSKSDSFVSNGSPRTNTVYSSENFSRTDSCCVVVGSCSPSISASPPSVCCWFDWPASSASAISWSCSAFSCCCCCCCCWALSAAAGSVSLALLAFPSSCSSTLTASAPLLPASSARPRLAVPPAGSATAFPDSPFPFAAALACLAAAPFPATAFPDFPKLGSFCCRICRISSLLSLGACLAAALAAAAAC
mmetsp:Transcript_3235/g.8618  ORF Transcript_3235/g.8618 Transcript_3235/m.8618 type:complete len:216 (-) Transcript_3235:27-674(-)